MSPEALKELEQKVLLDLVETFERESGEQMPCAILVWTGHDLMVRLTSSVSPDVAPVIVDDKLGCWCPPEAVKLSLCHAVILARIANE